MHGDIKPGTALVTNKYWKSSISVFDNIAKKLLAQLDVLSLSTLNLQVIIEVKLPQKTLVASCFLNFYSFDI